MEVIEENEVEGASYSSGEEIFHEEQCHHPEDHDNDDQDSNENGDTDGNGTIITGVLYGRSVRSGYACLHLYRTRPSPSFDNDSDDSDLSDDSDDGFGVGDTVLVRLQFFQRPVVQLRSHVRRFCKPGDLLAVRGITTGSATAATANDARANGTHHAWRWSVSDDVDTRWDGVRLVVDVTSVPHAERVVRVRQRRYWTIAQVQACQREYFSGGPRRPPRPPPPPTQRRRRSGTPFPEDPMRMVPLVAPPRNGHTRINNDGNTQPTRHHNVVGLLKRTQGEYLKNFLSHMISYRLQQQQQQQQRGMGGDDTEMKKGDRNDRNENVNAAARTWAVTDVSQRRMEHVRDYLNHGTGVLDVAGGSGHVSMALGLDGIQSTIVDPRDKVGKLPGRDRKVWNRAWKQQISASQSQSPPTPTTKTTSSPPNGCTTDVPKELYCQPVQYKIYRAWFGKPPEVRHDDQIDLPVCGSNDEDKGGDDILLNCSAIAALHPDEATDAIVDVAVRHRIPFVIVPCCVFYRLFPHRTVLRENTNHPVSTYEDLLDYLQAKDKSIQRTQLPFDGANTLLWSIF